MSGTRTTIIVLLTTIFVPKEYVEQLDDLQTHDPDLYRVARQGRFGVNGTLVFPQFVVESAEQVSEEIRSIKDPLKRTVWTSDL